MKVTLPVFGLFLVLMSVQSAFAQAGPQGPGKTGNSSPEQELIALSKDKWQWMAERNVEALDKLLAEEAVFVHMGATMTKSRGPTRERRRRSTHHRAGSTSPCREAGRRKC